MPDLESPMPQLLEFMQTSFGNLLDSLSALLVPAVFFALLALLVKGREALAAARRAGEEFRINFWLHCLDAVFMLPVMALLIGGVEALLQRSGVTRFQASIWDDLGIYPTLFMVLFLGDFEGYWRHRLEHTSLLWPSHAVHHSDTEMHWLTLDRFHPINRLTTTAIDATFLVLMGFPAWAVVANTLVRHYYGYFIHADLPWTYGPFANVFVSPAMHRWHHARELRYAGTNFATVFSVFDRAFGTFQPGLCGVPVGLEAEMGVGVRGQLMYPLRTWAGRWRARSGRAAPGPGFASLRQPPTE
jgi:sterol desaturase/sphingolipid hydroxylase (fatty acid hydroxylase superfamily)